MKIPSGSPRDKSGKTPRQNKWKDPQFRIAVLGRSGHKSIFETWPMFAQRKRLALPKK